MYDNFEKHFALDNFDQPISEQIWRAKYQYRTGGQNIDLSIDDTRFRVASYLVQCEDSDEQSRWKSQFLSAMADYQVLPAGRILAGAGTARNITLFNTFVMREMDDSVEGIMDTIKEAALTMKMGGGIGFDFSTLRPKGALVNGLDCPAAGPLAAMDICDAVCKMVVTGMGRGAMMATMRCDHPDIEAFVTAKSDPQKLRNFNLSVMATDAFIQAVQKDESWDLVWEGKTCKTLRARELWSKIMQQNYAAAEPGVLFIDRINQKNRLSYLEEISSTNSCAEQPLPPNGACPLASINLSRLVRGAFTPSAIMDQGALKHLVSVAVRMLDNVIELSDFAIDEQRQEAQSKRRIGIGVTGVADALFMMGEKYGTKQGAILLDNWMEAVQNAAYLASAKLAAERGCFPAYDAEKHLGKPFFHSLSPLVQAEIQKHGLRNGTLTTIAPTGTISMLAGNVSSGIEPIFSAGYWRNVKQSDGSTAREYVEDYAVKRYRELVGEDVSLPESFVTMMDLTPSDHVRMQSVAQRWVDSGISKTVNCPAEISFVDFESVYMQAYASGCKGCTTYRPNEVTGSILQI